MIKRKFNMGLFKKNGPKVIANKSVYDQIVKIVEHNNDIYNMSYVNCIIVLHTDDTFIKFRD